MGGIGDLLAGVGWLYLVGAGLTLFQLRQHWREFWDDTVTGLDRQLAGGAAFFLLVPMGVLLHEFGHMLAAWSTGSEVLGLHYFIYWGYVDVQYNPAIAGPLLDWYVALAGNFVSYLLGAACLFVALYARQLKLILRVVLMQLGILELVQTLIAYPLMSLDPNFYGDWNSIYSFNAPLASWATLVVHILSLAAFIYIIRGNSRARALLYGGRDPRRQSTLKAS